MSVAVYPSGCPTWSPTAEGYGNMSRTYRFSRFGRRTARNVACSLQKRCQRGSTSPWWYWAGSVRPAFGATGASFRSKQGRLSRLHGEALGARRGGARLDQQQGRGQGVDVLHVSRILAAPNADVNSTPCQRRWTFSHYRDGGALHLRAAGEIPSDEASREHLEYERSAETKSDIRDRTATSAPGVSSGRVKADSLRRDLRGHEPLC